MSGTSMTGIWHRVSGLLAAAALMGGAAACGGSDSESTVTSGSDSGEPLVIGVAAGITGYSAFFDIPALAGLETAVKDINERGGAGGERKVELDVKDTGSDPATTATVATELVADGADVLVTPCDSDLAIPGGQAAQEAQIPAFSLCAAAPNVPDSVGDYFFGTYVPTNANSSVMAQYAWDEGYRNAYLVAGTQTYTESVPRYFEEVFTELGGNVVGTSTFDPDQQDFSSTITDIKSASPAPDVIETSMYEPAFPAFMKQLRAAGVTAPVIGSDAIGTPTVLEQGAVMDGLVYAIGAYPEDNKELTDMLKRTAARDGADAAVPAYTSSGYDIGLIVDHAVEQAGGTDGTAMRDAIAEIQDLQGIASSITYDYPDTNRTPLKELYIVRVEGGKTDLIEAVIPDPAMIPKP